MLEGLEVTEIKITDLEFSGRLDSEYYKKYLLDYEQIVRKKQFVSLDQFAKFLIGPFGSSFDTANYLVNGEYRYVRGQDVKPFVLKDGENRYVPAEDFYRLAKYSLKERDILISVVGTLGNACIVQQKDLPAIFSCKSTVIRTEGINPVYVLAYLNSKFGKELLLRKERGAIQKGLNLDDLKTILIPIFSESFQQKIEALFNKAQSKLSESKTHYSQAEILFIQSIGLQYFNPSSKAVNIKRFKDSFGATGRMDAEYYQVKYDDYDQLVKSYYGGWMPLGEVCELKDKNFITVDEQEYQYIELADIGEAGNITGCTIAFGKELPSRARRTVHTGDVIISSIEGSLGSCAIVRNEFSSSLCSTGFYVINSKRINSESLLVLFKSEPMQNILKRSCSGTILTAINKNEFLQIPVPIITIDVQQKLAGLVIESFELKQKSEQLLETAKRGVEMAIEESEERAMEWMESQQAFI